MNIIRLSDDEKEYIRDNYHKIGKTMSQKDMAEYIGCSPQAIVYQAKKMGLHVRRKWTEEDFKCLYERYNGADAKRVAEEFGTTESNIRVMYTKAKYMALMNNWNGKEGNHIHGHTDRTSTETDC